MERYLTAPANGQFGKEHEIWKQFIELQRSLGKLDPIRDNSYLKVAWSVGQEGWTKVPWIALMDDRETDSTQRGVYRAILSRQYMTGVYLTLAQAVTAKYAN
jgi:5-methylcytosine-specific restriction protein B